MLATNYTADEKKKYFNSMKSKKDRDMQILCEKISV